jgi:hypothetical protein
LQISINRGDNEEVLEEKEEENIVEIRQGFNIERLSKVNTNKILQYHIKITSNMKNRDFLFLENDRSDIYYGILLSSFTPNETYDLYALIMGAYGLEKPIKTPSDLANLYYNNSLEDLFNILIDGYIDIKKWLMNSKINLGIQID